IRPVERSTDPIAPFFLDTGPRSASPMFSGEPGEVPENEVDAHLGNPGQRSSRRLGPLNPIVRWIDTAERAMDLIVCPHCNSRVVLTSSGECHACRREVNDRL